MSDGPKLEVFSPVGATQAANIRAPRLDDLDGKTVCLLSNWASMGEAITHPILAELLQKKYPGIKIVSEMEFPATLYPEARGPSPEEFTADMLLAKGCQAAISGNGG